ncbi:MAG TPA: hypothetical protein VGF63_05585 [Solirubrobacteraceae bacterium]|jgi:hypothetical protein
MARLALIASLATLLAVTATLAACGGDKTEDNRYIRQLTAAQTRFQANQRRLEADAKRSSTARENRRALDRFAGSISDTINALRRIDAPAKVRAEHRRFVAVFVTWHDDVSRFVAAVKSSTPSSFARARRRIAAATATFNRSSREAASDIDAKLAG